MLAENNLFDLTQADFESSRHSLGEESYAEGEVLGAGREILALLAQSDFDAADAASVDARIIAAYGDHRTYTRASWLQATSRWRNDLGAIIAHAARARELYVFSSVVRWISTPPNNIGHPYEHFTLAHLRADSTQRIAHYLQKSSDRAFNADVLAMLAEAVFSSERPVDRSFVISPEGVEIKWMLVSHPDTPQEALQGFTPDDLQWLSVLSHPNTQPSLLINVITSALYSQQQGGIDGGNISTALSHPWWTTESLRALCQEIAPALQADLASHVSDHPACPLEILESRYPELSVTASVRLASLSEKQEILEQMAYHQVREVREAVKLNPRAPEHVRTAAALGNLFH